MSDSTKIAVQRTIDAPANELFAVLTNPERHAELDGSGFVRSDDRTDRIQSVGDVFTMNMEGEQVTDKEVLQKVSFPLVSQGQLEDSLGRLAAAVAGS